MVGCKQLLRLLLFCIIMTLVLLDSTPFNPGTEIDTDIDTDIGIDIEQVVSLYVCALPITFYLLPTTTTTTF